MNQYLFIHKQRGGAKSTDCKPIPFGKNLNPDQDFANRINF